MSRFAQRLVGLLWRWHRRTGVIIFVFVLLLCTTGVVLNHTAEWQLDRRFVDARWLVGLYGDESADLPAYPAGEHWLFRAADGRLYFDSVHVGECRGALVGAAQTAQLLIAGCTEELVLLTKDGELVETVNASTGLPAPLAALGTTAGELVLRTAEGWRLADLERLEFAAEPAAGAAISQLAPGALPAAIRDQIPAPAQWLTWERVLLDLHSGRLFGRAGVWFMDLVAILLACIACSGLTMWAVRRGRHRAGGR